MARSFCTRIDCEMIPVSEERRKHKKRGTWGGVVSQMCDILCA